VQLENAGGLDRRGLARSRRTFSVERQCDQPDQEGLPAAEQSVTGTFASGGQSHFYMEPQTTLATPSENGLELWTGDQDPAFTQTTVSTLLGIQANQVNVKVRRVGGGFGGKLTRQAPLAAACALAAVKLQQPIFAVNERLADMTMTGGREPITVDYSADHDTQGKLARINMQIHCDGGWLSADASGDLAMAVGFSDNVFFAPNYKCNSALYKTHTHSRTSQRAPGVVQSITAIQVIMEHISRNLGLPFETVQKLNFYKPGQVTPWGDVIASESFNWTLPSIWDKLHQDASFDARSQAVNAFNACNRWRKRGIAMTPVKYGMSFNDYHTLAIVNIYADGSVLVAHGGCEIGQGIHTKVAQAAAHVLGIDLSRIRVDDTETSKAPNNTCTGGSGTSESAVYAVGLACETLNGRLAKYRKEKPSWELAVGAAIGAKVCLSAEGWSADTTPNTFAYATYGAAVSEVELDVLTGEIEILRVDVLMDLGRQLNAGIDIGQVEGGFVIALGYFFSEQVLWDKNGRQLNIGSWEYKIPSSCDVPQEFNVALAGVPNPNGRFGSKGSAEPPLSLAASAYFAAKFAVYASREDLGRGAGFFELPVPCTVEELQRACLVDDGSFHLPG